MKYSDFEQLCEQRGIRAYRRKETVETVRLFDRKTSRFVNEMACRDDRKFERTLDLLAETIR